MSSLTTLVAGAGPVGLAAAIELARRGFPVRIVDRDPEPTPESRAIAIHPRTLDLLEPSGATERLLAAGVRMWGVRVLSSDRQRAELDLSELPHRFNFILSLAQDRTERILIEVLRGYGVTVEQGTEVIGVDVREAGARVRLRERDGETEAEFAWVIGADGAHSVVRKSLGIGFPGEAYPFAWSLADVDLEGTVEADRGEIHLDPGRPILFRAPLGGRRHRLIANGPDVLERARTLWGVGSVHWQSSFTVSHRQADRLGSGGVWIVGDAAHIHSPAGGRGMNLGIEDAVTLVDRIAEGVILTWPEERRAQAAQVIRLSDGLQRMATADGDVARRLVPRLLGLALALPPVRRRLLARFAAL